MTFNAQTLLEHAGINIEQDIPLPYGLSIKISMANGAESLCNSPSQVKAMQGLMGVCQGVLLTLCEVNIPLVSLLMVANDSLGVIISIKPVDIIEDVLDRLGLSCVQELVDMAMDEIIEYINELLPGITVQYIEFDEIETLWYKIVNSKMVYVLQREYQSTHYSLLNGLDSFLNII